MLQTSANDLRSERLMEHLRVLCDEIGARPPTSRDERRAAEYVRQILETLGIEDIRDQFFTSPDSLGWLAIPFAVTGAIAPLLGGWFGKLAGGAALLYAAKSVRDSVALKTPFYEPLLAQAASQNVIARIAPTGPIKRRVFLVAHLDSGKQRWLAPLPVRSLTKPLATLSVLLGAISGATMLLDVFTGKRRPNLIQGITSAFSTVALAALLFDETQQHIEGANDNASSVAVLLGLAEALKAQPLENTEVQLVFTGAQQAGNIGMQHYLRQYAPPRYNSYWINLDMVGSGRLCYVTKHGGSYLTEYRPTPQITALAARVARNQPDLRVAGKELLAVDEVSALIERGYEAICISGYDDQGFLPNWHRVTDTFEKIDADILTRAARYTHALMREIDRGAES